MSTVFQLIKNQQVTARKNRDKVAAELLTTVLGELQRDSVMGKSPTDEKVFSVVKKTHAGVSVMHDLARSEKTTEELRILDAILALQPLPATDDEVMAALTKAQQDGVPQNIGALMKHLKSTFPVLNGAQANQLIKSFIN